MRDDDFQCLVDHGPELYERYAGKWIAVRAGEVIGVGATATQAAEQARAKAKESDFILEAIDAEGDVIYGGLQEHLLSGQHKWVKTGPKTDSDNRDFDHSPVPCVAVG